MKLKRNQLLGAILAVLVALIIGASVLLNHNFNIIGKNDNIGYEDGIFVSGSYLYVVDREDGLEIIDISDPTAPIKVGQFDDAGYAYEVFVSGSYAYVADGILGLRIIDISDPTAPTLAGQFNDGGYTVDVFVSGSYAYVEDSDDGLEIIDISDPAAPVKVGIFNYCNSEWGCLFEFYVSGSYLYAADSNGYLRIIDISDPTTPVEVDEFIDGGIAENVFVSGSYAYVVGRCEGLKIIDISDPTAPTIVGQFDDGGCANEVYVSGSYAYVAEGLRGLEVIDISDPTAPVKVGQFYDDGHVVSVFVSGSYAYILDYHDGLVIIDPLSPKEKISNIILWSIICILTLLVLADIGYFIKKENPLWKENLEKLSHDEHESVKHVICFIKGFLITHWIMIIFALISFLIIEYLDVCPSYSPRFNYPLKFLSIDCGDLIIIIEVLSGLVLLGIIVILIEGFVRNKNPYTWMGKIGAIFGLLFLIVKRNYVEFFDPYLEHPKKKKNHFLYGFLISIGLLIIYSPVMLLGLMTPEDFDFWSLAVVFIILLNIFIGVLMIFFKEKLRYISIGMIPLLSIWIILVLILISSWWWFTP